MLNKVLKDEKGGVSLIVAFSMLALVIAAGCAIDMSRAETAKAKIQIALDAAALAAGKSLNTVPTGMTQEQWVQEEAQRYFNLNYQSGYLNVSHMTLNPAVITTTNTGTTISLSVNGVQSTTLMGVVGTSQINIGDSSQVTTGSTGVELVLVLDNTGSMNDTVAAGESATKIEQLKSSATQLINTVLGTGTNAPNNVFVGIVPFTQAVNIGTNHTSWLSSTTAFPENSPWFGCVTSRSNAQYPLDISDAVPNTSLTYGEASMFQQYYFTSTDSKSLPLADQSSLNIWNSNTKETNGTQVGPNDYCPQPLTQMTNNSETLITAINNMTAQGDTLIDIGLAWGNRMLSPAWNGIWGGFMNDTGNTKYPTLPLQYNTPGMQKIVVLMTDGWNHVTPGNYTAYDFLNKGNIGGATSETPAETNLVNYTEQVCNNMKNNGIIIYTIGYGQDIPGANSNTPSSVDTTLLQNCATDSSHYFLAPTNAALQSAFAQIGGAINQLRVSK